MNLSFRKAIVAALAWMVLACLTHGSAIAEEVTRVFLFAGQSNMVGADAHADRIDDYPNFKGAGEPHGDVLFSYILGNGDEASQGWVPLKPLRSFGPEVTFARRVRQQAPFPIAIIKSAVGGTTVALDWNPDAPVSATWKVKIPSSPRSLSNRATSPWPRIRTTSCFVTRSAAE